MGENFAILRVAKIKNIGGLAASGKHNFRERETPNADAERTHLNVIAGAASTAELTKAVSDRLPEKRRKDAVIAVEYLITASPEHFGADWRERGNNGMDYFADALDWLKQRHGESNVVAATIHLDESTPHMAAYVVPLKDGKLSAKHFTGGRATLAKMQTDFAERVGQKHGLQRGVERSQAVHKPNAAIAPMTAERLALRKQVKELSDEIERLTQQVGTGGDALAKMKARLAKTAEVSQANYLAEREMAGKLAEANKLAGELRKQLDEALTGLAEARGQSDQMAVKLREAGAALSAQGAALAAAENEARRLADALQEVQAREGKLLDQVQQQRAAAVAAAQPSKARMEVRQEQPQPRPTAAPATVADSLEAAMEWVKSAAGKVLQVKPGGWYIGQVRHADEHHAVQAQGGGNYVIHRQEDLPQRLDVSPASVEIRYGRDGRVSKLEVKPQQSRGLGLGG